MNARITCLVGGTFVIAAAPWAWGQPPGPNIPILRRPDVTIEDTNMTGDPQGAWTVTFDGDEDPDVDSATISGGHARTGGAVSHPDDVTDMTITFAPSVITGETVTFGWNMGDSQWSVLEYYFSGANIGPSNSCHPLATEDFQHLLYRLDNGAGPNQVAKLGGADGTTIISDVGYRFTDTRLALADLGYDSVNALGATSIPGTWTLSPGDVIDLPVLAIPPGEPISQLIYRVRWSGVSSDYPEAWMAIQLEVPEPATLALLAAGVLALLRRRVPLTLRLRRG